MTTSGYASIGKDDGELEELPELFSSVFGDDLDDDEIERSQPVHVGQHTFNFMLVDNGDSIGAFFVGGEVRATGSLEPVARVSAALVEGIQTVADNNSDSLDAGSDDSADDDWVQIDSNKLDSDDGDDSGSKSDFHAACGAISHEAQECAAALFTREGHPRGAFRSLVKTNPRASGLLYIEEVHVLRDHRGAAVALDLIEGLLQWLNGRYSIAVMHPAGAPPFGKASDAVVSLARYFARVGFQQIACSGPQLYYWCLAAPEQDAGNQRPPRKSREDAGNVKVLLPQRPAPMTVLDQELHDACVGSCQINTCSASTQRVAPAFCRLGELIAAGAHPTRACALHVCATNVDAETARELLELGASVNGMNKQGNAPLHLAASQCGKRGMLEVVSLLLSHGASLAARNEEGRTPYECARRARREAISFRKMKGLSVGRDGCLKLYDACASLLSIFVQQPERDKRSRVH